MRQLARKHGQNFFECGQLCNDAARIDCDADALRPKTLVRGIEVVLTSMNVIKDEMVSRFSSGLVSNV